jgi:hypothetical protein
LEGFELYSFGLLCFAWFKFVVLISLS